MAAPARRWPHASGSGWRYYSDHKWPAERACPEVVSDAGLCTDDFTRTETCERFAAC